MIQRLKRWLIRKLLEDIRPAEPDKKPITREDILILSMCANGLENGEIAAEMNCYRTTLDVKLRRLRARTGAKNCKHLVAIGFRKGWIK